MPWIKNDQLKRLRCSTRKALLNLNKMEKGIWKPTENLIEDTAYYIRRINIIVKELSQSSDLE